MTPVITFMEKPSPETTRDLIKCERLETHSSRKEHTKQDERGFPFGFYLEQVQKMANSFK